MHPGISGYEVVKLVSGDQPVPTSGAFAAGCPTGKKVFAGGVLIERFSPAGPVGLKTPVYSIPTDDGTGWAGYIDEVSGDGNLKATFIRVTIYAICGFAN